MQQVPGYKLHYDNKGYPHAPLFHFNTINNGNLGGVITIDCYDWGDGNIRMPNFEFKDREYGGFNGACTCGATGLDTEGIWACGCSFPC
jgi:hypothetical protein